MLDLSTITTYQSGVIQASAYRVVKRHTAQALRDYNLSCMQWFTIGTVLDSGSEGTRLSDLAVKLDTSLAYMTTTVNLLESRNILTKKAHKYDARTKLITVSSHYVSVCEEIEVYVRNKLRTLLYDHISHEELASYVKVLTVISSLK